MPYQYNNMCFATIDPVVDILKASYSASYKNIVMTPNAAAGTILVTMQAKSNNSNVSTTAYVSTYCDELRDRSTFDKIHLNDLVFAGVLVLVFIHGFGQGKVIRV